MQYDPHRNIGAAFTRADGSTWERNAVHVPAAADLARRGYKLLPEPPVQADVPEVAAVPVSAEWPLLMSPPMYLRLHPTGLHAALARRLEDALPANDDVAEGSVGEVERCAVG